jgi:hypothetical protein
MSSPLIKRWHKASDSHAANPLDSLALTTTARPQYTYTINHGHREQTRRSSTLNLSICGPPHYAAVAGLFSFPQARNFAARLTIQHFPTTSH